MIEPLLMIAMTFFMRLLFVARPYVGVRLTVLPAEKFNQSLPLVIDGKNEQIAIFAGVDAKG